MALCSISSLQLAYANSHEANGAATVGKCEGMANIDFSLSYLDADKDGNISKEEYLSGNKSNTEKIFNHIDANNDGKLDSAEQKEIEAVYKAIHTKYKTKSTSI